MGRSDVAEAMVTLRWLHEAIETMTNGDDRAIKIVPYHIPVVKWCDQPQFIASITNLQ